MFILEETKESVLIIGDVHGCLDDLKELLNTAGYVKENFTLIFVGDVINKGPQSVATLRFVRSLPNVFIVKGNHEVSVVKKYKDSSYGSRPKGYEYLDDMLDEEIQFIDNLPAAILIPRYRCLVVHAGFVPNLDIDSQDITILTKVRNLEKVINEEGQESYIWHERPKEGKHWVKYWEDYIERKLSTGDTILFDLVCYGHDAKRRFRQSPHSYGLDSGCVYGKFGMPVVDILCLQRKLRT